MVMTPCELVLSRLPGVKRSGKGWKAHCPSHDDRNPSLSVWERNDGSVGVKCQAGCDVEIVLANIGLTKRDLQSAGGSRSRSGRTIVATYDYRDEAGRMLFQVVRYEPKDFRQRKPNDAGGWDWSTKGVRAVPYRLPELKASDPNVLVFVVEGEKDAEALVSLGFVATTNAGGAGKWTAEQAAHLAGRNVVIIGDNDEPGRRHAQQVAATLHAVANSIKIVELGATR